MFQDAVRRGGADSAYSVYSAGGEPSLVAGVSHQQQHQNHHEQQPRVLNVALVGAPNAGKSLLLNRLVNSNISAVSPKCNTTRANTIGVHTARPGVLRACPPADSSTGPHETFQSAAVVRCSLAGG